VQPRYRYASRAPVKAVAASRTWSNWIVEDFGARRCIPPRSLLSRNRACRSLLTDSSHAHYSSARVTRTPTHTHTHTHTATAFYILCASSRRFRPRSTYRVVFRGGAAKGARAAPLRPPPTGLPCWEWISFLASFPWESKVGECRRFADKEIAGLFSRNFGKKKKARITEIVQLRWRRASF